MSIIMNNGVPQIRQENNGISFDSTALNGLRGLASIHIMLFHAFLYSGWHFNIYGHVSI